MRGLKDWVESRRGNITKLADGLNLTQPAVSKWFLCEKKRGFPIVYAKKIMHVTGLSAKAIYPEMYELFKDGNYKDCVIERHDELELRTEKLRNIVSKIEDLHAEAVDIIKELNDEDL